MNPSFQIFPEQASATAQHVDYLAIYLIVVATVFSAAIFMLILYFAVKYRRRSEHERPLPPRGAPSATAAGGTLWRR